MSQFPSELKTLAGASSPTDIFERAWKIVQECGEEERHFNQLQSVYRGVASTWLLATFGAVGYVLFNKDVTISDPNWNSHVVSAAICVLGATGICLIWILDLKVYHQLLMAVFEEGRKLETEFAWLPRFRTGMHGIGRGANKAGQFPIQKRLALYYVVMVGGLLFAAMALVAEHLRGMGPLCRWWLIVLPILAATFLYVMFRWTGKPG